MCCVVTGWVQLKLDKQPHVGPLLPPDEHGHYSNDHHSHTEPCGAIDDGTLHGLQEMVLTGITTIAQRTRTCGVSIVFHTVSIATAVTLAALLGIQVHELAADIHGGVEVNGFSQRWVRGGGRRGAVGLDGSRGFAS